MQPANDVLNKPDTDAVSSTHYTQTDEQPNVVEIIPKKLETVDANFSPESLKESTNMWAAPEENNKNNFPIELPGDGLNRKFLIIGEVLIVTNGCYIWQKEIDEAAKYNKYLEDWLVSVTS